MRAAAITIGLAGVLALGLSGAASAQATGPKDQARDPNMPSQQNTIPEKIDSTGSTGNLSDRLQRSEGVIKPPGGIDPDIAVRAPVPNPGTTPVIPPPGSPGGNSRLEPR